MTPTEPEAWRPYHETPDGRVKLYQGDARRMLEVLPEKSVQCVIISEGASILSGLKLDVLLSYGKMDTRP